MEGLIFDIKCFAIHDGPGLRTTVFFKGCPLDCWWCHNPESKNIKPEGYQSSEKLGTQTIKVNRTVGQWMHLDTVFTELKKQSIYMKHGRGGVTLSGGEPLMQPDFATALLKKCKAAGWHTAVDTSGYVPLMSFLEILNVTDLFLFDIKLIHPLRHKKYTGVDNQLILDNFKQLTDRKVHVIARIPIIPEINTGAAEIELMLNFLKPQMSEKFYEVHLLPFHNIGQSKYERFKQKNRMSKSQEPHQKVIEWVKLKFEKQGFKVVVENQ